MTTPRPLYTTMAVLTALLLGLAPSARAGWTPGGVTVLPTTSSLHPLAATNDGGHGSFVAWQEITGSGLGVLHAQHVLSTGDVDPAWPASGASVCATVVARTVLGTLADHHGGCYVWWMEGQQFYVTRLGTDGTVAAAWPARGRLLGTLDATSAMPSVIADGVDGFYAAWVVTNLGDSPTAVRAVHLGPDNTGAGGWTGVRTVVAPVAVPTIQLWPQLALASDGGVFLAWGSWSQDEATQPSAFMLRRLTSVGTDAPGWSSEGQAYDTFSLDINDSPPIGSLVALSPDGRDGVFLVTQDGVGVMTTRLRRITGAGQDAAGWPAAGFTVPWASQTFFGSSPDLSVRVFPDGLDGAMVGAQVLYTDSPPILNYTDYGPDRVSIGGFSVPALLTELLPMGDGRVYVGTCRPWGPYGPWDPPAFITLDQFRAPPSFNHMFEYHNDIVVTWYGDIALASSGDGGAVFFWSQERERFGLFARHFTAGGEVTAVPPTITALALRGLRFVPGQGVRARIALPGGDAVRLELFDVAGRRVASERIAPSVSGERDLTLAGTGGLGAGVYFARLDSPRASLGGRVIVLH